jgi:predicted transcriptional regulator
MAKLTKQKNTTFSFRISSDLKNRLSKEAKKENRPISYLAESALSAFLKNREFKNSVIEKSIIEADKYGSIESGKVLKWMKDWSEEKSSKSPFTEK